MDDFISDLAEQYGAPAIGGVLDQIKTLGFKYATQAGITISKNDIVIPPDKQQILDKYEAQVEQVEQQYERGLITEDERREAIVDIWTKATDEVGDAMQRTLYKLNPVYMMANSGARGSFKQIRQLAGMRGLMANPKGEIIERPIQANFMEGLSVLEYFISTHGARKGLADTALRTADSGYLTRRLVDVAQDVIIREEDCGTDDSIELKLQLPDGVNKSVLGRVLATDVYKPLASGKPGKTKLGDKGALVTKPVLAELIEGLERDDRHGDGARPLGAQVPQRLRRVPGLLRRLPRHRRDVRDRRRGRHHRRAVDRRAGHPADDADVPHRRRRRGRHHARPPARGRDLRGTQPEGRGAARRRSAGKVHVEETERGPKVTVFPEGVDEEGEPLPEKEYQLPRRTRLLVAEGRDRGVGRSAARGLARPGRAAGAPPPGRQGLDPDRALPRRRGAAGLQVAGRRHPRQAHRADRAPDAQEGARRQRGRHRAPARPARRPVHARARERRA